MLRIKNTFYFVIALVIIIYFKVEAQDGQLDLNFDSTGIVATHVVPPDGIGWTGEAHSTLIQTDAKIITVGFMGNGSRTFITLVRYNKNGIIDSSFGRNGVDTALIGSIDDRAYSALLQSDGKIIVGGYSTTNKYQSLFALVRFNTDGSRDITFGLNGVVTTAIGQSDDKIFSIAIQKDGKIVAAGASYLGINNVSIYAFALARYNSDGSLDNTFGTNGIVITALQVSNILQKYNKAKSVAIQNDGKIVIGGYSGSDSQEYFALLQYNIDGSPDNSFNTNGIVLTSIGAANDQITSIAIQNDGKIVAGGYSQVLLQSYYIYKCALARYNTNGSLDNTFGTNGIVTTSIEQSDDAINSVLIQSDGKIIAAGDSKGSKQYFFAVARYSTTGALDNSFGTNGIVTTPVGPWDDRAYSVAIQRDGKIVASGSSQYNNFYNLYQFAAARYSGSAVTNVYPVLSKTGIPEAFALYQNYPNPFNPATTIRYTITKEAHVTLKVYDEIGRAVETLVDENKTAGQYNITFNAGNLSSGIYYYRIIAGEFTEVKKLILLK